MGLRRDGFRDGLRDGTRPRTKFQNLSGGTDVGTFREQVCEHGRGGGHGADGLPVKDKFSKIYSELVGFGFDKMSVEFTFDNTLIYSLNKNNNKYLLQYFLDFEPNEEDDIEIIFSNISNDNNKSIETEYSSLNKVLSEELLSYELAY